jgi:UDP-N-acetylmuramyl pentapeptide phosphotransferase/UDP-N-acetylglucosamine-1-phosphate transferase
LPLELMALLGSAAFGISAALTWRFCRPGSRFVVLDHPNERSLHTQPTPRTGGVAIMAGIAVTGVGAMIFFGMGSALAWTSVAVLLVVTTSFIDDRVQLPAMQRIVVHFIAAGLIVYGGLVLNVSILPGDLTVSSALVLPATVLYLVWMVNLYNFMDGIDGLAGGMAVIGFGVFAVLGVVAGQELFTALSLVIAASAGGFLLLNFPPARIFMGDSGSSTLGLLAGVLSIWGAQEGVFPFWVALLVFSPFIADASVTLVLRAGRRERLWEAHRTHYYQRLVRLGWGHLRTVLWEYVLMTCCAVSALWVAQAPPATQWVTVGFWVCAYSLLGLAVRRLEIAKRKMMAGIPGSNQS